MGNAAAVRQGFGEAQTANTPFADFWAKHRAQGQGAPPAGGGTPGPVAPKVGGERAAVAGPGQPAPQAAAGPVVPGLNRAESEQAQADADKLCHHLMAGDPGDDIPGEFVGRRAQLPAVHAARHGGQQAGHPDPRWLQSAGFVDRRLRDALALFSASLCVMVACPSPSGCGTTPRLIPQQALMILFDLLPSRSV